MVLPARGCLSYITTISLTDHISTAEYFSLSRNVSVTVLKVDLKITYPCVSLHNLKNNGELSYSLLLLENGGVEQVYLRAQGGSWVRRGG